MYGFNQMLTDKGGTLEGLQSKFYVDSLQHVFPPGMGQTYFEQESYHRAGLEFLQPALG